MSHVKSGISTQEPVIWSSVIRSLLLPMKEHHINAPRLLQKCGISEKDLEHLHTPIPMRKYLMFMQQAAIEADDPILGIRLSRAIGPELLGALGFLFLSSATLYEALTNLCRYESVLQDITHMTVRQEADEIWFTYGLFASDISDSRQDIELSLALTSRLIRMFCGSKIEFNAIHFQHGPSVTPRQYELLLGTKCYFAQESNSIRMPASCGKIAGKLFDPNLLQILQDYLDIDLGKKISAISFSDQLRNVIFEGHIQAPITAQKMATHLGISTATLNRRLNTEGLTFKELVDRIHFDLAKRLLRDSSQPITQIAHTIGFSSNANFTRAFTRWSDGISPSQFRRRNSSD